MAGPVVIDMGMAEPAEVFVTSMVEACTKAVGDEGQCHLVRDAPPGLYRAIAILTWDGPDKVRIEVGLRRDDGTEWRTRSLSFQPEDAELERFRSVGFVVGTLATEEPQEPPPIVETPPAPPPPPPRIEPPPPPPPPPPEPPQLPASSYVGLVGTIGGALDEGAPRYGGSLRARLGIASWLGVIASASGSFRPRDDQGLALRFFDAGLGLGFVLEPPRPFGWELDVEALIESFRADADAAGASQAAERLMPAARIGFDLVWAASPPIEVVAGADLLGRPASTTVVVADEAAGSTGTIEIGIAAGARLVF
jgi:hypothetical protein